MFLVCCSFFFLLVSTHPFLYFCYNFNFISSLFLSRLILLYRILFSLLTLSFFHISSKVLSRFLVSLLSLISFIFALLVLSFLVSSHLVSSVFVFSCLVSSSHLFSSHDETILDYYSYFFSHLFFPVKLSSLVSLSCFFSSPLLSFCFLFSLSHLFPYLLFLSHVFIFPFL